MLRQAFTCLLSLCASVSLPILFFIFCISLFSETVSGLSWSCSIRDLSCCSFQSMASLLPVLVYNYNGKNLNIYYSNVFLDSVVRTS